MDSFVGFSAGFMIIFVCFAVGSFLALPLIWYHVGFISRKLDKTNQLLVSIMKRLPPAEPEKKEESLKKYKVKIENR